ncbi:GNAT family N-acetyltransferase [Aidingimonas lacisalsi]|uniref:GNAT family N-acetyltransferase n=1 Tax=Aidingimonas lacisalsi TaxID=2604086 RepID=UPI0011D2247D|nr:GNAT family N-acetyltransferase [Aidingimonas lacisalsi]
MQGHPADGRERSLSLQVLPAIESISPERWNALVDADYPFLRHEFLHALEASGAVCAATGWEPRHLTAWRGERLVGAMPCYRKYHSFGEYVFDWAWADAWERAGGRYYPKALTAIPFTPAPGPRLLLETRSEGEAVMGLFAAAWENDDVSSWHLLFADDAEIDSWQSTHPALVTRHGLQFQWRDDGYGDFEGFLSALTSRRRKEIRRERRIVADQGLEIVRLVGEAIDQPALEHFFRCYRITYLERGQQGYLNFDFFQRLRDTLPEALVLIQARADGRPVAAALCLQGSRTLYGRYWGSEVVAECLHFEACYYQGIEHCLAHGLTLFDPGTQGEHKLTRGFAPRRLRSLHHIDDPGLRDAVARFCREEREHIDAYANRAQGALPFKR